jgi:cytochrome c5
MRLAGLPALGLLALAAALPAPVYAQGQGGYAPGCPGAETVRMSSEERARARAAHQTNDTSGGRSSIDKSCKTWEAGGTADGPQPGTINWHPDVGRGLGGAHTRF